MSNILIGQAVGWIEDNHKAALAVVIRTWGSAPRPMGSLMIIRDDSCMEGSVSGGCVETDIMEAALKVIDTRIPVVREYGIEDKMAWSVGLSCGGDISVMILPICEEGFSLRILKEMDIACKKRDFLDLCILLQDDGKVAVDIIDPDIHQLASEYDSSKGRFVWRLRPNLQLVMVGAGHISQILCQLAQPMGYDVHVIDPRATFADPRRFKGAQVHVGWPRDIIPKIGMDWQTAVVTLTHDPKIDDEGIIISLEYEVFYIGCLGSKRTHSERIKRLEQIGVNPEGRLYGPAGLPLGGRGAAEIALSILAQIVTRRYS